MNADKHELNKFGDLAHHWWDPAGEFRTLHEINPLRLGWIKAMVALNGVTALDVGCGGGLLSEAMAAEGAEVLGIDLSTKALKVAELHALDSGLRSLQYREVAVEQLASERPGAFGLVTCMEMLEHVPDPASVVAACARLAAPGSHVMFSTLNRNPKAFALAIVAAEHMLQLLPRGTHEYARFLRPSELAAMARSAGLEVIKLTGLHHNPLTRRYWLSDDVSVNYMMACRVPA